MKKRQKRITAIVVAVVMMIIIVFAIIIIANKYRAHSEEEVKGIPNYATTSKQEFVKVLENGVQLNTSEKLHETKILEGMEISDFQMTEKDNVTLLLGTITNISDTTQGGYAVNIEIVDKQGNEMITVSAFLGRLEPGESTQLSTSTTLSYVNAYDFRITRKY